MAIRLPNNEILKHKGCEYNYFMVQGPNITKNGKVFLTGTLQGFKNKETRDNSHEANSIKDFKFCYEITKNDLNIDNINSYLVSQQLQTSKNIKDAIIALAYSKITSSVLN